MVVIFYTCFRERPLVLNNSEFTPEVHVCLYVLDFQKSTENGFLISSATNEVTAK